MTTGKRRIVWRIERAATAATIVGSDPYQEIGRYCRMSGVDTARVFRTLSYFDGMNLARYITTPRL